jgi:hypothetical protein
MELAQDRVQWRALVLAVLNLEVLLPDLNEVAVYGTMGCKYFYEGRCGLVRQFCTLCQNASSNRTSSIWGHLIARGSR